MADNNVKVWFITGCSTGFGRALTEVVLLHGNSVIATARKLEQIRELVDQYPETALAIRLDVTNPIEVRSAVSSALDAFGHIDVLVNNAVTLRSARLKRSARTRFGTSSRPMSLVR